MRPRVTVVCGATGSGKSGVADEISCRLSEARGYPATTIVVDSMQVYREIPWITNQPRARPAELTGIVSVTDAWTVARHRYLVDDLLDRTHAEDTSGPRAGSFVLDAGTGMYLNAILMDIDLAPRVGRQVRAEAVRQTSDTGAGAAGAPANPRRRARQRELELVGAPPRGSIWTSRMRLDADILYLRPPRHVIDAAVEARSIVIATKGIAEARHLISMTRDGNPPTPQVLGSIGVRELMQFLEEGERGSIEGAGRAISTRTRRLVRRQTRWFDKMVRTLKDSAAITVAQGQEDPGTRAFVRAVCQGP